MKLEQLFLCAVSALQLGAAATYAAKRRWPEAIMMFGAALANFGALLIPGRSK